MTKPSVYVETSIVSYLTVRPSRDLIIAAQQAMTRDWWRDASERFVLVASELVLTEAAAGDADAAVRRRIQRACRKAGYEPPVICTLNELMEEYDHGGETDRPNHR